MITIAQLLWALVPEKEIDMIEKAYNFHHDAGHGWLEMPLSEFRELDISVSGYSYYSSRSVYLEEDCDAGLAIDALKAAGISPTLNSIFHDGQCFIRELWHFITEIKSPGYTVSQA